RKIDFGDAALLDPASKASKDDRDQGYIPVEKIRLGRDGFETPLGDGLREIYDGRLTVQFADPQVFAETPYAKAGENHRVLLALRFLRQQAALYYNTYGSGYPDKKSLLAIDRETARQVRAVIEAAPTDTAFLEALKN